MEVFAEGVAQTEGETVGAVDIQTILRAELQIEIAHLEHCLVERSAAGAGVVDIDIVEHVAEQVADVEAKAKALGGRAGKADVCFGDAARSLILCLAVGHGGPERIAHGAVGKQTGRCAHSAAYGHLQGDVVESAESLVARSAGFGGTVERHVGSYVKKKRHRVYGGIAGGIHHIDLTRVAHGISDSAHLALRCRHMVVEHSVAEHGVWRILGLGPGLCARCRCQRNGGENQ
ncbi:hypothetical protein IMSAGC006_02125 [Muribaculaceae bacterium]|nr:hypothetical protein IMSAGC006_02125 [Muribaculaceae bacterium]